MLKFIRKKDDKIVMTESDDGKKEILDEELKEKEEKAKEKEK